MEKTQRCGLFLLKITCQREEGPSTEKNSSRTNLEIGTGSTMAPLGTF
jgi:hypothetical protein